MKKGAQGDATVAAALLLPQWLPVSIVSAASVVAATGHRLLSDIVVLNTYNNISISPCCNLLANMMHDAIYYFPMMYCVSMYIFEQYFIYGNGEAVGYDVWIDICYLL